MTRIQTMLHRVDRYLLIIFILQLRLDDAAEFIGEGRGPVVAVVPSTVGFDPNGIGAPFIDGATKIRRPIWLERRLHLQVAKAALIINIAGWKGGKYFIIRNTRLGAIY